MSGLRFSFGSTSGSSSCGRFSSARRAAGISVQFADVGRQLFSAVFDQSLNEETVFRSTAVRAIVRERLSNDFPAWRRQAGLTRGRGSAVGRLGDGSRSRRSLQGSGRSTALSCPCRVAMKIAPAGIVCRNENDPGALRSSTAFTLRDRSAVSSPWAVSLAA